MGNRLFEVLSGGAWGSFFTWTLSFSGALTSRPGTPETLVSSLDFSFGLVTFLYVFLVGEGSPDGDLSSLVSSELVFLATLVVTVSGLQSLVLDGVCSLDESLVSVALSGVSVDLTSESDGVLLGILDLVLSEPGELWSFVVVAEILAPSVETVVFAETPQTLLPAAEDAVLVTSLVVRLVAVVWWDSPLPDAKTCGLGLYMSEVAEGSSKSEHSESVLSLTKFPRLLVSPCAWSSVVDADLSLVSWTSASLSPLRPGRLSEERRRDVSVRKHNHVEIRQ